MKVESQNHYSAMICIPYSTSQMKVKVLAVRYGTGTLLVQSRYTAGTCTLQVNMYARGMLVALSKYIRKVVAKATFLF